MTLSTISPLRAAVEVSGSLARQGALSRGPPIYPLTKVRNKFTQGSHKSRVDSLEPHGSDLRVKGNKMLLLFIALCLALDDVSDVHN